MTLVVKKFGGTSVATPELIRRVAERVVSRHRSGDQMVVVVSAMGATTDALESLARRVPENPSDREMDMLMASGERSSMSLLAMAVNDLGVEAVSMTGGQSGIITDAVPRKARILEMKPDRLFEQLDLGRILIVAGFQGVTIENEETTLGRGGSNLSAVALAYALNADVCEMNTDVDGIYTADPRVVPDARKLDVITPEEMLELASAGARVLQSRSVEFASKHGVTIAVRSSFNQNPGTLIKEVAVLEEVVVRGIAHDLSEGERLIRDLGLHHVMILQHHGLLTAGSTIQHTIQLMFYLETCSQVQIDAMSTGNKLLEVPEDVAEHTAKQFESYGLGHSERDFAGLKRRAERADPSFKD